MEDFIVTPDGRRIMGMNQVLEYAPGAKEIQVYQDSIDAIRLNIVAGESFGDSDKKALLRELRRRLGPEMRIEFRRVDHIPRSATGKLRAVVRASHVQPE